MYQRSLDLGAGAPPQIPPRRSEARHLDQPGVCWAMGREDGAAQRRDALFRAGPADHWRIRRRRTPATDGAALIGRSDRRSFARWQASSDLTWPWPIELAPNHREAQAAADLADAQAQPLMIALSLFGDIDSGSDQAAQAKPRFQRGAPDRRGHARLKTLRTLRRGATW